MPQLIVILILSLPIRIGSESRESYIFKNEFIVWNVGQGLFTTRASPNECTHYDIGGEFLPLANVLKTCARKSNQIHLSHLDWDHINFAKLVGLRTKACLMVGLHQEFDELKSSSQRKVSILESLPICSIRNARFLEIPPQLNQKSKKKNSNESSRVVLLDSHFLVSGDSPSSQEKYWSQKIPKARVFVLGHHGSRTSNSQAVFARLDRISMAVASARKRKYGHPHAKTLETARKNKTPVLLTEDWGSLHFEI